MSNSQLPNRFRIAGAVLAASFFAALALAETESYSPPIVPDDACSPVESQMLMDTNASGDSSEAERAFGVAMAENVEGKKVVVVGIGNNYQGFYVSSPSQVFLRAKTGTGLTSGGDHGSYKLSNSPAAIVDGFQYGYFTETGGAMWWMDINKADDSGTITAARIDAETYPARAATLTRLGDGRVVLCAQLLSGGVIADQEDSGVDPNANNTCECWVVYSSSGNINATNPTTWVTYNNFGAMGAAELHRPTADLSIDGDLAKYVIMNVPAGGQGTGFKALVNIENFGGDVLFFQDSTGKSKSFSHHGFGRVQTMSGTKTIGIIADSGTNKFHLFEFIGGSNPALVPLGGWVTLPAGTAISFARIAGPPALAMIGDSSQATIIGYDITDPANPTIVSTTSNNETLSQWWKNAYATSHPYHKPQDFVALGENSNGEPVVLTSAAGNVYTTTLPCDLSGSACSFSYTSGSLYPGQSVSFTASVTAASYQWNFGDGTTGSGKTITHTFQQPGTFAVHVQTTGPDDQCSQNVVIKAPNVSVSVSPPNAVTGQTVVSASQTHDGTPAGSPPYTWKIYDQNQTTNLAGSVTTTVSGGPNSSSWGLTFIATAAQPQGYMVCVDVNYTNTYAQSGCFATRVHVGANAADFAISPSNPTTANNVTLTDATQGTEGSHCWSVINTESSFTVYPQSGEVSCNNGSVITPLVIDKSRFTPCSSGTACYKASLTVGSDVLSGGVPGGDVSTAEKNFTMAGSCTSATFSVLAGGGSQQICADSSPSGTTGCSSGCNQNNTIFSGSAVNFVATCTQPGTTYDWDFGDGSTHGSGSGVAHTYSSTGLKSVKLTVNGSYTDVVCIDVDQPTTGSCSASFSFSPSPGAINQPVYFTNNTSSLVSSNWSFSNGSPSSSTATNPTSTWSTAGTYNVTLNATCSSGSGSLTRQVTISGTSCSPPPAPTLTSPANGASNVGYSSGIYHSWTSATGAAGYNLNLYIGSGCSATAQLYGYLPSTSYTVSYPYQPNTTYSWRITPYDSCGTYGTASSCFQYTTANTGTTCPSVPTAPSNQSPAAGASGVNPNNVSFNWSSSAISNCTTTYDLYVYNGSCGGTPLNTFGSLASNSYVVGSLPENSSIAWNVIARNEKGQSSPSGCSVFTTGPSGTSCTSTPPGTPSLASPANGASNWPTSNATFSWYAASCADVYDVVLYNGGSCGSSNIRQVFEGIPDTFYTIGSLPTSTTMSWSVTAKNSTGSAVSGCNAFVTAGVPGTTPTASFVVKDSTGNVVTTLVKGRTYTFDGSASSAGAGSLNNWSWSFGDGGSDSKSSATTTHAYSAVGTFTATLTVRQSDNQTGTTQRSYVVDNGEVDPPGPDGFLIAAAAHGAGVNDTTWLTDIKVFNPASQALVIRMQFRPENADNSGASWLDLPAVQPNATLELPDVIYNLFGSSNAKGAIYMTYNSSVVSQIPLIQSNTYNKPNGTATGTYGQYIPAIPIYGNEAASAIYVEGVRVSADSATGFRTNAGVVNIGGSTVVVTLELWSEAGTKLGTTTVSVPPYGQKQLPVDTSKFAGLTLPLESAYLRVIPSTGAKINVYCSVIDNQSGDGTYLSDVHAADPTVFIGGMAASAGSNETRWASSLFLINPTGTQMDLWLEYIAKGSTPDPERRSVSLPPAGSLILDNVITELFGMDETSGTLRVRMVSPGDTYPLLSARTYNTSTTGTYGQTIPAVDAAQAIGADRPQAKIYLPGLARTAGFRTNVGIYNQDKDVTASFDMLLYDGDGNLKATKTGFYLFPEEVKQYNDIFATMGITGDVSQATLVIRSSDGKGAISAFASVVDNYTGDPLFVPGWVLP